MQKISDDVKKSLSTEEEPFEGEVPQDKIEEVVLADVASDK